MPLDSHGFTSIGRFFAENDNAIALLLDGEVVWFPLSQVKRIVRYQDGRVSVTIPPWLAEKKGLLEDDHDEAP